MDNPEEEFVPEEETATSSFDEDNNDSGPAAIKSLREKLKKAVAKSQEYLEGWQRARADMVNYKRAEADAHGDKEARIKQEFLESLLPALDSFEMAFGAKWYQGAAQEWKGGVMSIYRELVRSLERFGIMLYTPLGERFDPQKHEAVRETAVMNQQEDHTVVSVERSGYSIGEKIIRPAQVTVGVYNK
jgi:molecular chaperone GrpE